MESYSISPSKTNKDAIKYARAFFNRHLKYEDFSANSINLASKLSNDIIPLVNKGIQTIPNFWDRELIGAINNEAQKAFNNLQNITVRDYLSEDKNVGKTLNRKYIQVKFNSLKDLKGKTSGVTLPDPLLNIPSIYKLLLNEKFVDLITAYYSVIPKLTYLKVRHAFASEEYVPQDTQLWHFDPGSFRQLKVIVYLDDIVSKDHGPHEYIKKSHSLDSNDPIYQNARMDDDYITTNFSSQMHSVLSNKEDLNLTDATGIHRGLQPKMKDRTVLIANFFLHRETGSKFSRIKMKKSDFNNLSKIGSALFDDVILVS
jgi:hypothetical protein